DRPALQQHHPGGRVALRRRYARESGGVQARPEVPARRGQRPGGDGQLPGLRRRPTVSARAEESVLPEQQGPREGEVISGEPGKPAGPITRDGWPARLSLRLIPTRSVGTRGGSHAERGNQGGFPRGAWEPGAWEPGGTVSERVHPGSGQG